jgi:hypothetical protein
VSATNSFANVRETLREKVSRVIKRQNTHTHTRVREKVFLHTKLCICMDTEHKGGEDARK